MGKFRKNLEDHRFGRLVATSFQDGRWRCVCDCGKESKVDSGDLLSGNTQSCGCLARERRIDASRIHAKKHGAVVGGVKTRTYSKWAGMWSRCTNPKANSYEHYGGRGISVCERWKSFENFLADMGEAPPGLSIDRYPDNDGNYEPGNCRWATSSEQMRNTRVTRWIEHNGERLILSDWAARAGVSVAIFSKRLDGGWSMERALTTPTKKPKVAVPDGMKRCTKCELVKCLDAFYRRHDRPDGDRHYSSCKLCSNLAAANSKARKAPGVSLEMPQ
jgi:hypothetical protein